MRSVSTPDTSGPPLGVDAIDRELARLRERRDRISLNLIELENNQGHQFLTGAELHGDTRRRWDDTAARIAELWQLFDGYRRVGEAAERLRADNPRPGGAVRAELTRLLTGPSVEIGTRETSLRDRTLLGDHRGAAETLTLARAVERMTDAYDAAVAMVGAADSAWTVLLERLAAVEERWQRAGRLLESLGAAHPGHERTAAEVDRLRAEVRGDPLSFHRDGRTDTGALDRLLTDIDRLCEELAEADRLRGTFDERAARLSAALDEVATAVREAREARAEARRKIHAPGLGEVTDPVPALRDRLHGLTRLRGEGRWGDLAATTTRLESDATEALAAVRAEERAGRDLLARRSELRGRWEAYRMKSVRIGAAEDPEVMRWQRHTRDLLWTAPCDLDAAATALTRYQEALRERERLRREHGEG